jgi:hypothetical protein
VRWSDLRAGRSNKAMTHYYRQGRLHLSGEHEDVSKRRLDSVSATFPLGLEKRFA